MRIVIAFLIGLVTAATVVALGVLVAQNGQSEQLTFLGGTVRIATGAVVAGAAALGFLLACLLLIPGRVAASWRRVASSRQAQTLDGQLRALREEHARLEGSHQRLLAEHHRVLEHVLVPVAASGDRQAAGAAAVAAAPAVVPPVAATPSAAPPVAASGTAALPMPGPGGNGAAPR